MLCALCLVKEDKAQDKAERQFTAIERGVQRPVKKKGKNKMKKLMIAAAIVCAAAMSQAASIDWSSSNIYKYGSTSSSPTSDRMAAGTGLVYLFCSQDFAQSQVTEILSSTTTTAAEKNTALKAAAINDGVAMSAAGKAVGVDAWTADAGTYNYYMLIFNDNAVKDGGKYVMSALSADIGWDGANNSTVGFSTQKTLTTNAANWSTVATAVPEPTSGLLLLLGMAGLALRRRRA